MKVSVRPVLAIRAGSSEAGQRAAASHTAARDVVLRVARVAELLPEVAELDINPLIVRHDGAIVVDARVRGESVRYTDPH